MKAKEKMYRIIQESHICGSVDYIVQKDVGIGHYFIFFFRWVSLKRFDNLDQALIFIDKQYAQYKIDFGNRVTKEEQVWP